MSVGDPGVMSQTIDRLHAEIHELRSRPNIMALRSLEEIFALKKEIKKLRQALRDCKAEANNFHHVRAIVTKALEEK